MDQKNWNNRTPFTPGKSYIPAELFAKYSAADLLKYGLRKWPDGTAVELNAGIYSHARLLVPMKQKIQELVKKTLLFIFYVLRIKMQFQC